MRSVLQGEVRHNTTVLPPGVASMSLNTKVRLDPAGEITGESTTTAAGPYATALRGIASRAQGTGTEPFAANILGNDGGTGDITVDPLVPITEPYHLSGSFRLAPPPGWLDGDSFELPTGLGVLSRPGDGLAGPMQMRDLPDTESTPWLCWAAGGNAVPRPTRGAQAGPTAPRSRDHRGGISVCEPLCFQ
jgi:hypothetical protein